ncbi:MAG: VanZ family protein, partial [Longimicrobiales bacterium]
RRPAAVLVILLAAACGAADELHQRSVPGRSAELADWVVDVVAVLAAFTLVRRAAAPRKDA